MAKKDLSRTNEMEIIDGDIHSIDNNDRVKKEKKPRGCFLSFVLWLIFILVGIGLITAYFALNHKFFNINKISIIGNHRISEQDILDAVDFKAGDNIFRINSSENEDKLLNLKGIESAKIRRIIPNKVQIEIFEIFDIGYIQDQSKVYIIDKDGYVKEGDTSALSSKDLIEFTSINTENIEIGMNISEDEHFKDLINAIKTKSFYKKIEKIDLGNFYEFIMYFKDGLIVTFQYENIEKSMDDLEVILNTIDDEGIEAKEIIMNIGEHPVIIQENPRGQHHEND